MPTCRNRCSKMRSILLRLLCPSTISKRCVRSRAFLCCFCFWNDSSHENCPCCSSTGRSRLYQERIRQETQPDLVRYCVLMLFWYNYLWFHLWLTDFGLCSRQARHCWAKLWKLCDTRDKTLYIFLPRPSRDSFVQEWVNNKGIVTNFEISVQSKLSEENITQEPFCFDTFALSGLTYEWSNLRFSYQISKLNQNRIVWKKFRDSVDSCSRLFWMVA